MRKAARTIIIIELFAIVALLAWALERYGLFGARISINPMRMEDLIFSEQTDLPYFWEPKPNKINIPDMPWLPDGALADIRETINSDSLNERFEYSERKPKGVFRIIALGDSFTYGWGVNTADNYPEQLEDLLNSRMKCENISKFEVINLGVGGYDIRFSVERFRLRGKKYDPDLVLWFLKFDDFVQIKEITIPVIERYRAQMASSGELERAYRSGSDNYPFAHKAMKDLFREWGEEGVYRYQAKALATIDGYFTGALVFFTLPRFLEAPHLAIINDFAASRSNTWFFRARALDEPRLHFPNDTHPTKAGYAVIAEDIFSFLTMNNLIPCRAIRANQ